MLVVGLTGGIATGKSTVSALLKSHSVDVIDADVIAREVVAPGTKALSQIVSHFGNEVLHPDGSLNRPKLGTIIFGDESKRRKLNSIVHPAVRKRMLYEVFKCWVKGKRFCVIDVPLLIETGLHKWVGKVVVVSCTEDAQLSRLMARDKSTEDDARARIGSQMPIAQKRMYADEVIDNNGPKDDLNKRVVELLQNLKRETRWTWLLEWLLPPSGLVAAVITVTVRAMRQLPRRKRTE